MKRARIGATAGAATLLALALVAPPAARAQLADCPSIQRVAQDYVVVLSNVSALGTPAGTDLNVLRSRLLFKLETSEETLKLTGEKRGLRHADCPNRKPTDGSEFDARAVDALNSEKVVLELWGTVVPASGGGAKPALRMNFAVIPLLKLGGTVDGRVHVSIPREGAANLDELAELLAQGTSEVDGLASLAVGLRYLRDGRFDTSLRLLCEAQAHLARSMKAQGTAAASWEAMRQFAVDSVTKVFDEALKDPSYQGRMRLRPTPRECPK
jgi:hypothetical protein